MRAKLPGCRYPDVAARLGQGGADAQVQPQLKLNRGDPIHYEFTLVKRDRPDVSQNVLMWPAHVLSRLVAVITVRYHAPGRRHSYRGCFGSGRVYGAGLMAG